MQPIAKRTNLSLESLLSEVERVLRDAREDRAHGACVQALALVVKIHELIHEQEGADRFAFRGAKDVGEIMELMFSELGGPDGVIEMTDMMREAALSRRAEQAQVIS
jgi:hypothetical protein